MPAKQSLPSKEGKKVASKKTTTLSLRATAKQSSSKTKPVKIATSPSAPRNDADKVTRGTLSVPVYSLAGKVAGTLSLPKEIFGGKVNQQLLAQAMRVYLSNQKTLQGSTKTRGEVEGSTAKIYNQKGTGRARHGGIRAPIFVGGGIVFGPKPRKVVLDLPRKMKKAALYSALASKVADNELVGLTGLEKATGKTKEMTVLVDGLSLIINGKDRKKNITALIVTGEKQDNVVRGVRNIQGIDVIPASQVNSYEVLKHQMLLITKEAIASLQHDKEGNKK